MAYGIDISEAYASAPQTVSSPCDTSRRSSIALSEEASPGNIASTIYTEIESCYSKDSDAPLIIQPPAPKQGWLFKRGQIIPSWKRRYVVLEGGVLNYYVTHSADKPYKGTGNYYWVTPRVYIEFAHCKNIK